LTNQTISLTALGWRPVLQTQLTFDELEIGFAARVDAVYRNRLYVMTEIGDKRFWCRASSIPMAVTCMSQQVIGHGLKITPIDR
jgi:hypothetical protein